MTDPITAAMEAAETEDTVTVALLIPTQPGVEETARTHEVTLSGLMEVQAILERGGLIDPGNVVNEAEAVVRQFLGGQKGYIYADHARDVVAMLAEKGLLR